MIEYRAEVIVQGRKSATAAKRPHYSHLTPATTFAPQAGFDVGRVKAQMMKAGMDVVEVRYFSRVTTDWKLDRREDCARYEVESSPEAKERRVGVILGELKRLKHSHYHECFSERQKMMIKAKADLLAAAKGKRRYLYRFAKNIERAAVEYVVAYDYWRSGLRRHRELIDELRRLAPKFDKRKATSK